MSRVRPRLNCNRSGKNLEIPLDNIRYSAIIKPNKEKAKKRRVRCENMSERGMLAASTFILPIRRPPLSDPNTVR